MSLSPASFANGLSAASDTNDKRCYRGYCAKSRLASKSIHFGRYRHLDADADHFQHRDRPGPIPQPPQRDRASCRSRKDVPSTSDFSGVMRNEKRRPRNIRVGPRPICRRSGRPSSCDVQLGRSRPACRPALRMTASTCSHSSSFRRSGFASGQLPMSHAGRLSTPGSAAASACPSRRSPLARFVVHFLSLLSGTSLCNALPLSFTLSSAIMFAMASHAYPFWFIFRISGVTFRTSAKVEYVADVGAACACSNRLEIASTVCCVFVCRYTWDPPGRAFDLPRQGVASDQQRPRA